MKPGLKTYVCAGLVIVAICFCVKLAFERHSLSLYRHYIEAKYQMQLSLIEREMQIGKEPDYATGIDERLAYMEARDNVRDRIQNALSATEIFTVSWSSDGHHGLDRLKHMPTGYTHFRGLSSKTADGSHTLYCGRAEDGTSLLIYEGWLVNSPWKREYHIAFTRSNIDKMMNSK